MYNPRSSRQSQKKISGKKDRAIEPSGNFLKVLKSKNGYIVDLSNYSLYPSSNTYYKINGNIIREEGKYTLDLEPKPVIELWEVTKAKSLMRLTDEITMDVETYDERFEYLKSKLKYDGEVSYMDSDEEFLEYRKLLRYKPEFTKVHVKVSDIEIEIVNMIESPNEYIKPMRHLGNSIMSMKASYARRTHILALFKELFEAKGYYNSDEPGTKKTKDQPSYKIYSYSSNNEISVYANGGQMYKSNVMSYFQDEYDVVMKKFEDDRTEIESIINAHVRKNRKIPNAVEFLIDLKNIKRDLVEFESDPRNPTCSVVSCGLDELIEKVEKILED